MFKSFNMCILNMYVSINSYFNHRRDQYFISTFIVLLLQNTSNYNFR